MLLKMTMSGDGAGHGGQTGRRAGADRRTGAAPVGATDAAPAARPAGWQAADGSTSRESASGSAASAHVGGAPLRPGAVAGSTVTGDGESAQTAAVTADDERLARARAGDDSAFAEMLRRHQAMVFSLALRIVGNRALAEELAQEVFLQLHRSLPTLESGAHVAHWLRRVVSNRAIDLARQMARRPQASLSDLPEFSAGVGLAPGHGGSTDRRRGGSAAASLNLSAGGGAHAGSGTGGGSGSSSGSGGGDPADPFITRRLRDLVASLPAAPRAVVTLRFQEDLDLSEIAATLNMPLNTVKSHLRRSLALLRGRAQALLEPMNHVSRT
jgi:RNA polymerase sigma-70 factor (ECF subfamily)